MANILIIEDQRDIADALASLLKAEGHSVEHVAHGQAALEKFQQGLLPDLVLLDLATPVMDGYEFRRRQLAEPALAQVPVIVLSATNRIRERQALRADAVFTKPVDFPVLCKAIEACLSPRAASTS